MDKIDCLKQLKHLYGPSAKKVESVEVPEMNFLMIDGAGDPNTAQEFKDAVEVLFSLSYTLKFMLKKGEAGIDYGVLPLEALWWSDDPSAFTTGKKDLWKWTVMVMQPDFITSALVDAATKEVQRKKKLVSLSLARFEAFKEGKAAQILYVGPFTEEGPTIEKVHSFIESSGSERRGKHHEIYLSDIRRAAPEKWKTIIRQPMSS
ncbi:GyrI-like domain-containing protein [Geomonas propionica]|uniref:GyrI-like domain-containing protein n=1 Tax=Geomonas propionica TaxID=2798582 RepID=A0ABS0YRB4_9BACT|nr:GyrI-like domain-containing protein [Geomonas propionica]MBJ6800521.1 GyrI-like domain-containing protein [Geomonas propionica]